MIRRAVRVRVQLLGAVRVWRGAELAPGPPQRRAVLALLALAGGHPVSRDELIGRLWPEAPPAGAVNVIQTQVKHLRRALEPEREPRTASTLLPAVGDGYALCPAGVEVDALRFRGRVAAARAARAAGDRAALWAEAGAAVRMWRPPVPDLPQLHDSPRLHGLVAEWHLVLGWYADAALARGCAEEVLPVLQEQAGACPLDERVQARLLRAYHAVGRRDAAFAAYRRVRRQLAVELGVDPCAELDAAHLETLGADVPARPRGTGRGRGTGCRSSS